VRFRNFSAAFRSRHLVTKTSRAFAFVLDGQSKITHLCISPNEPFIGQHPAQSPVRY